jgi:DNA-binding CsgD family transcriptional regulator
MAALVLLQEIKTGDKLRVPHMLGRQAELAALQALVDGARNGSGGAAVVHGERGSGKSTLLEATAAAARGMQTLRVSGIQSEAGLAEAGIHQLVWPLLHRFDDLPDVQAAALRGAMGQGDAPPEGLLVGAAILTLLTDVARHAPVLVLVDDAHWLDQASADALAFAARRLANERVAMVFASTVDATQEFRAAGLRELTLPPLTKEAALELLTATYADMAPLVQQRLIAESTGNPLALIELSNELSADQIRGRDRLPLRLRLSARLLELYSGRLDLLPAGTQELLLVAAAEPSGEVSTILEAAASMGITVEALEPAESAHVVTIVERKVRFIHALERAALYARASFDKRIAAHRSLALVVDGDDRRAWHMAASTVGHDDEVAGNLEEFAEKAGARRGPAVAAVMLERAAALSETDGGRSRRLTRAARSALDAGHFARAHALLDEAERMGPSGEVQADIAFARGLGQLQSDAIWIGPDALTKAAAQITQSSPDRAAMMLAVSARMAWLADDQSSLDETWRAIAKLPLGEGALMKRLAMSAAGPTMDRALSVTGGIFRAATEASEEMPASLWMWPSAQAANMAGELVTAQRMYRRLVVTLSTTGVIGQLTSAWSELALVELCLGRWADAAMHASEALRLREMGDVASTATSLFVLSRIAGAQGRDDEARRLGAEASRLAYDQGSQSIVAVATANLGGLEMGQGRYEEAIAHFQAAARADAWPDGKLGAANWAADLVAASVQTGRLDVATSVVEKMESWTRGAAPAWARVAAHRARALISKGDQALAEFEAAVSVKGDDVHTFEMAKTQLEFGEALRRLRLKTEARRQLRAAQDVFGELGAQPWLDRAQAELRATGVSVATHQAGAVDQLTSQELQIARLGALGMSNREIAGKLFLSPRTVGFHLSNVFGKLGIASRGELRGMRLGEEAV